MFDVEACAGTNIANGFYTCIGSRSSLYWAVGRVGKETLNGRTYTTFEKVSVLKMVDEERDMVVKLGLGSTTMTNPAPTASA